MTYDFNCPTCRKAYEVQTPASKRDDPRRCPKGHRMRRQLSRPLAVRWEGRFQGRWDKVAKGEW